MPDYFDDEFEWDEDKSEQTFVQRHFDFEFASEIFKGPTVEAYDEAHSEREDRFVSVGTVENVFITVVYTLRGARKRIISARLSERREIDEFTKRFGFPD